MGGKVKAIILALFVASGLSAQWRINLVVNPRPPRRVSEWRRNPGIVTLTVTYLGAGQREAIVRANIRGTRFGQILIGESNPIMFSSGIPVTFDNSRMINWDEVRYSDKFERILARTGELPSDEYEICVSVYEAGTPSPVASRCATFEIVAPSPPSLISPSDGDTISLRGLMFRWTPLVTYPPIEVRYRIRVWEFRFRDNIKRAMSRPPIIDQTVSTTTYLYPLRGPRLTPGGRYIWAVQAVDADGNPIGTNNGMSEVWRFVVGRPRGVRLPRVLKIGNFIVRVSSYDASSRISSLSGTGRSFFYDEGTGDRVWFHVEFTGLVGGTRRGDTIVINRGTVVGHISPPLNLHVAGFTYHISEVNITPDSAVATLYLTHPCLFDTASSNPWRLGPFTTAIDTDGAFFTTISSSGLAPFRMADLDIYFQLTGNITIDMAARSLSGGDSTSSGGSSGGSGGTMPGNPHLPTPSGIVKPGNLVNPNIGHIYIPGLLLWRGVVFESGRTIPRNEMRYSNIGYLYGYYTFSRGVLTEGGFKVTLNNSGGAWHFTTVAPYGFEFVISGGEVEIDSCRVKSGYIAGRVRAPRDQNGVLALDGSPLELEFDTLIIDSTMSFYGDAHTKSDGFRWGWFEIFHPSGDFKLRFTSEPREYYPVVSKDSFTVKFYTDTLVGMLTRIVDDSLIVHTRDLYYPTRLKIGGKSLTGWVVLDEQGISGRLWLQERVGEYHHGKVGHPGLSGYKSDSSFNMEFLKDPRDSMEFYIEFAGNAVFDSRLDGKVDKIPEPTGIGFQFRRMNLTSTARLVGGKVNFTKPETLDYWGVTMTCRTGYMSVPTGEVIFTDANISEPVHFSQPFNIIWGEIAADGNILRMDFNQNSAYQTFDGFAITLDSAGLSEYRSSDKYGALVVKSYIHFQFFGQPDTSIVIFDYKSDSSISRYTRRGRYVRVDSPAVFGLKRDWGNGLVSFDLDSVTYDTVRQNGFLGSGKSDIEYLDRELYTAADIKSTGIRMCIADSAARTSVNFDRTSLMSIRNVWGCAYVEGNELKRMVIGGSVSGGGTSILLATTGAASRVTIAVSPTVSKVSVEGRFEFKGITRGVEADAYARLVFNRGDAYLEGDIYGTFRFGSGIPLISSNSSVTGRFTFHVGADYTSVQGEGTVNMNVNLVLIGAGAGVQGGFFLGVNVPKNKAWVLTHRSGRFGVNMANLPSTLTGFYVFGDIKGDLDLGIFGGGVEVFLGIGAMNNGVGSASACVGAPLPYVIGDLGVYLYGEILWGLVSAGGSFEGQFIGPCPFAIEGTIELEGCVLWVACGSIGLTVGLSSEKGGFYIE